VEIRNVELGRCIFICRDVQLSPSQVSSLLEGECALDDESEVYALAKGYFDLKEFDRFAFFTKGCKQPRNRFIHFYSRFLKYLF
jgi:anaphase-promoting complex subunit 8